MAETYKSLTAEKFGYVRQDYPSSHFTVSDNTWYLLYSLMNGDGKTRNFLIGFPEAASTIRHKKLLRSAIYFQGKSDHSTGSYDYNTFDFSVLENSFNEANVTWNNAPDVASGGYGFTNYRIDGGTAASNITTGEISAEDTALLYANGRCVQVEAKYDNDDCAKIYINPNRKSSGSHMYWRVEYDDAVNVTSKPVYQSGPRSVDGYYDPLGQLSWSWTLENATVNHCLDERWTQASAVFYWRVGSGSYHSIPISGSTQSVTPDAFVFPTGSTIEYYVKTTDTDGTTAQFTSTQTFKTNAVSIAATSYPSGNNVDNRVAQTFKWRFQSTSYTAYPQGTAAIKWRVSGASSWNTITASGTTKSVSVPAYTFPANSTIQWYAEGTDYSGAYTYTDTYTFKTLPYTLTITTTPNSSNVDTRTAQTFAWTLTNSNGGVTQSSYIFYWRVSGGGSYNQISKTTATKLINVPANTFPTASTIQWYISVTANDGTVLSSNAATFSTVSTRITLNTYPSGSSVDFGSALKFTWYFKSNVGNYGQQSAKLYWRADSSDPWTTINASGSTQSITVPAYTFPSNSTIYWYLEGTDVGGYTTTTSQTSFKTVKPQITPQDCPTSGYADPREAITFSWFFSTGGSYYNQQSASLFWREEGTVNYTEVAASGSTTHVTIAANTFPVGSAVEWYLSGVDAGGTSSQTSVYTFSTTASTAYAICQSPVGTAIDGTKPTDLVWIVENEDGSGASRTVIKWKLTTDVSWTSLLDTTDPVTQYTVAANTFPAGAIQWKVTAYNRDSVAGPDSNATFVCLVAPDAPVGLTATAVPFTEISWQSSGQDAYEISIDGEVAETGFGSAVYSWKVKEPLEDGAHTISVRIQGVYGLWSDPASTQVLIENVPKGTLDLSGAFGIDANLFWEYSGSTDPETIAVYRDGVWIGKTAAGNTSFLDRFALDEHIYRVEYWFADGYYTRSNDYAGIMETGFTVIAELSGGDWLSLRLSENSDRSENLSWSRQSSIMHITAAEYPVLEYSAYRDQSGDFECAFKDRLQAKSFESLRGKTVILKLKDGTVMIGGLVSLRKNVREFYTAYQFTIQHINWEDFVTYE